jgi:Fanconi anemia group M protein
LTASPGGTPERIDEITNNLFIKSVEIRSEIDEDVETYIQPIKKEWVYVKLPQQFQTIKKLLEEIIKDDINWLKEKRYLKTYKPSKKRLLELQRRISAKYSKSSKNYGNLWAMLKTAEAIKLEHALELLETQGLTPLYEYLKKLSQSKKKTDKRLINNPRIRDVIKILELHKELDHPKFDKLVNIIKDIFYKNPHSRIIVFANYRKTVNKINRLLKNNNISSKILIGQSKEGLKQREQIEILNQFNRGEFSVLVTTSIGEEGLDILAADVAIFYEAVPSEIRVIQRRGRVGRHQPGRAIFLITKNTRDEAYYWTAFHKEKKMKSILYGMKKGGYLKKKKTLLDWTK